MAVVNKGIQKKRGRPATGKDPVLPVRLPIEVIKQIDQGASATELTRSAYVRRLIEIGLKAETRKAR